jgi:hypothetical protein
MERGSKASGKPRRELRRFGYTMAVALALLAALLLWRHRPAWPYIGGGAALFALLGTVAPQLLRPVEKAWMILAGWLSVVMTYVVLTLAFFLVVTPLGLLRRVGRRDPLQLRLDRSATSYWVPVEPDGPGTRPDRPY